MTPKENLEISIKALSAYNIRHEIIKDMLHHLNKINSQDKYIDYLEQLIEEQSRIIEKQIKE